MNHEDFADLVEKSQAGNEDALIELLLYAHTPVSYLSGKILQNERTARQITQEVLDIFAHRLDSLIDAAMFDQWICRITAARCVQAMPLLHRAAAKSVARGQWQCDLEEGAVLSEEESAELIQQMADSLPENQRLCILLLSCGGLSISAIAQLTGFSASAVKEHIVQGQDTIQQYLWEAQNRGVEFTGVSSLNGILHAAMFQNPNDEEAIPVVYGILGKPVPVPPNPGKWIARILGVILAAMIATLAVLCGMLILRMT